jgi:cyclin A
MVAQYAEDIYDHLRAAQGKAAPDPQYMETFQTDINATMREILVDWLVEVAEEYKLSSDTLYLSVWYIDRVLSVHPVPRAKLQLVGVTCMLVAAKYEEIYAPQVDEFCYITDNTYERQDVLAMERTVLDALDFELTQPTVKTFLRRCLRAADADAKTEFLANYLAEASLLDYRMLRHPQSSVAASAVYVARETLGIEPAWTPTLERYAKVAEEELRECVAAVRNAHAGMQTSKLSAVREKYAQVKFKCVSMIKPLECR